MFSMSVKRVLIGCVLSGALLLIHGSLDDNVHPQNSAQFAYELQKAGKPFQMMLYPRLDHGVDSLDRGPHLRRLPVLDQRGSAG